MSYKLKIALFYLATITLCLPGLLGAEEPNFNSGLFFRLQFGIGHSKMNTPDAFDTNNSRFISVAPYTGVQIGGFIIKNFAVYGGINRIHATQAKESEKRYDKSGFTITMLSMGFSYYFQPYNIYISSEYRALGRATHKKKYFRNASSVSVSEDFDSGNGWGFSLGKEWYMPTTRWNVGLAIIAFADQAKGRRTNITEDFTQHNFNNLNNLQNTYTGLILSSTYH